MRSPLSLRSALLAGLGIGALPAQNQAGCPLNGFSDVNADGLVDIVDLLIVLSRWGTSDPYADCDHDGVVGINDLLTAIAWWGA